MQNHPADQEPRRVLGSFFAPKSQNTPTWEQRKLAELTKTITTGKSVNSDEGEVSDGDIGVLKTSCVSYDRFNSSESKPVVKSEQQLVKCAVEKDSVIVSRMNTPERVGACGYVSTDFPNLFLPDRLWKLKFQDTVDTYFVYMMLVSSAYKEKITSMASGTSGSMYNIPKETFLNLQLVIPAKIDEQKQLGKILKKIDTLITLHQRKYEKLVNIKKSMLDKMFPQNGASVPEIRFKGFTDPWEQRKLGELFEESDERASDREILSVSVANGIYPASESDRETNPGASLANYKIVHFGDVVYNSMRMWQGAVDASRYDGIVSPAYVVARPNSEVYARFFARLLRQPMLLKQYQQVSQGNSKDTQVLKFDDFASIGISMPASENEQRRIGGFFDRLDSLITLHQRKLELLRNIKKSLLDKMFV